MAPAAPSTLPPTGFVDFFVQSWHYRVTGERVAPQYLGSAPIDAQGDAVLQGTVLPIVGPNPAEQYDHVVIYADYEGDAVYGAIGAPASPFTPAPPTASVFALPTTAAVWVDFTRPVQNVLPKHVDLVDTATSAAAPTSLKCLSSSYSAVSCSTGAVSHLIVTPKSPLVSGASYDLDLDSTSSGPLDGIQGAPDGVLLSSTSIPLATPHGVTPGSFAVTEYYAGGLSVYAHVNPAASSETPFATSPVGHNPNQVSMDNAGDVFVAQPGDNTVVEFPVGGGAPHDVGTGLSAPTGVAVDSSGNVFIADSGHNRVVEVPAAGGKVHIGHGLSSPNQLAVDAKGDVFVTDQGRSAGSWRSPRTEPRRTWPPD